MKYDNTKRIAWIIFLLGVLIVFTNKCANASYENLIQSIHSIPPERAENLSEAVQRYSDKYGVGQDTIFALMWHESHFRNVIGDRDLQHRACGYLQIRTHTFEDVMGYATNCNKLIYDWREGIEAGVKYFGKLKAEYSYYSAISSYNAGFPVKSNSQYVREVLQKRKKVKEYINGN